MRKILFILSALLLTHCSLLELLPGRQGAFVSPAADPAATESAEPKDTEPKDSGDEPRASAVQSAPAQQPQTEDIELLWEIPKVEVEGYVIYYGFSDAQQTNQVRLKSSELEKYSHPTRGTLYRWVLRELPTDKPLFVSLAAYNREQLSARTKILEVPLTP